MIRFGVLGTVLLAITATFIYPVWEPEYRSGVYVMDDPLVKLSNQSHVFVDRGENIGKQARWLKSLKTINLTSQDIEGETR